MSGHLSGKPKQTGSQIMDQINATGYHTTRVDVEISLNKKGVQDVASGELKARSGQRKHLC